MQILPGVKFGSSSDIDVEWVPFVIVACAAIALALKGVGVW